jgi:hypothetical protein
MSLNSQLLKLVTLALFAFVVSGCGGVAETKVTVQSSAIEASVKKTLDEYASTGKVGSNLTSLESDINGIAGTDAGKAANLKKAYAELQQVVNEPQKVKEKAKEMLGML